eukprot:gene29301-36326_t
MLPVLSSLATQLGKTIDKLVIYDPYWCKGNTVSRLAELGFINVINRNRDFYKDIKNKQLPDYDILVTNPPYSGEHKVKLLAFLASRPDKPFALLLPAYTATKSYWKEFIVPKAVQPVVSSGGNAKGNNNNNNNNKTTTTPSTTPTSTSTPSTSSVVPLPLNAPFYVLPPDYYEYCHPEGTGKEIPPFYSAWFVGGFDRDNARRIITSYGINPRRAIPVTFGTAPVKRLPVTTLGVMESVDALVRVGLVTDKRPNPKLRKKNRAKMMGGASGGGSVEGDVFYLPNNDQDPLNGYIFGQIKSPKHQFHGLSCFLSKRWPDSTVLFEGTEADFLKNSAKVDMLRREAEEKKFFVQYSNVFVLEKGSPIHKDLWEDLDNPQDGHVTITLSGSKLP